MLCSPSRLAGLFAPLLAATKPFAEAYQLDPNSTDSVKTISKSMATDLLSFYHPEQRVGLLPDPYYWWEAGAMFGALIDYWYYTKDDQFNDIITAGLLAQVGEHNDYMPADQRLSEGNDDQGFWGLAVMSAAENNFPNPPKDKPQWLALAQAVFNTQAPRWDTKNCNGGLRWQIFDWNAGFDYKNSISQACFFALGARLALYTGNKTYADWAAKTWDWTSGVGFIDKNWYVYDGATIGKNCTDRVPYQFSYNAGGFILGAAAMYNFTEDQMWKDRLDGLLKGSKVFFPKDDIMVEVACESVKRCNLDQQSFKAYLSRWMAAITKWAPYTYDVVMPYLRASAVAAAKQCTGGDNGRMCGLVWTDNGTNDGLLGVGQQMAAMEVTLACMVKDRSAPVTSHTGGTSEGDAGAGGSDVGLDPNPPMIVYPKITSGQVAGAAIITVILIATFVAGIVWLLVDETSDKSPLDQFKGSYRSTATAIVAFAAGGGAAAAVVAKPNNETVNEKGPAGAVATNERSPSLSSGQNQSPDSSSMKVGHVRHESSAGQQRRLSNMPRGWPHNQSVRSSMLLDSATDGRPTSMQPSLTDRARHSIAEAGPSHSTVSE